MVEEIFAKYRATGTAPKKLFSYQFTLPSLVVFEPFPYTERYSRFLKICLSSPNHYALVEWVGWVKSRFGGLLLPLEVTQGFCDPNPTEYVDSEKTKPNVIFY
ncbi:nuclear poly(A) polymerase 3-like [Vigna radiata var. radiata]|uniref:Nuclear poly(A) polymerase 3-like n=1 Tax=Vigna radiata var. radiata TaxID=3916 RepID=A0A3Q0FEM7_VIGRR|nr:nuclear poly(A) polymerase 3-like [Vigna radiata var. radiata]